MLVTAAAALASMGSVQIDRAGAQAWSRPCSAHAPRADRQLLARCARVHGRVIWRRAESNETHLALIASFHLFVVKVPAGTTGAAPGSTLTAVGPLVRASNGLREVEAFAVQR